MINNGTSASQIGATAICVPSASPTVTVFEFFNTDLKHYFRTAEVNNRFAFNDSNHRFTTDLGVYNSMIGQAWVGEGIVMCALP